MHYFKKLKIYSFDYKHTLIYKHNVYKEPSAITANLHQPVLQLLSTCNEAEEALRKIDEKIQNHERNDQIFGTRSEIPAIDLSRVPKKLMAIMSYAKHKHKTTGVMLTPTYIIKDFNERNNTANGLIKNKLRKW